MAQTKNIRRVAPTEARAKLVNVRISPQKLNLVAASIRGMPVQKALNELEFSRKRIATDVRKVLYSAISNAENNHNLDIDNLIVAEAFVGKNLVMKRFASRARGRSSGVPGDTQRSLRGQQLLRRLGQGSEAPGAPEVAPHA